MLVVMQWVDRPDRRQGRVNHAHPFRRSSKLERRFGETRHNFRDELEYLKTLTFDMWCLIRLCAQRILRPCFEACEGLTVLFKGPSIAIKRS